LKFFFKVTSYRGEYEDTKEIIRIRKSEDRKHNCQQKKDKRHNDLQNTTQKTKDPAT